MKQKFSGLAFSLTLALNAYSQVKDDDLFPILEEGKFGFINRTGQVVIQPAFFSAENFSEGLSPVRQNGTYGYIDMTGKFVIMPQFDYATAFHEGLALVYKGGEPFFINRQGVKPFDPGFAAAGKFENGRARIQTTTGKSGFIDRNGKLFIDTVYLEIGPFIQGFAVVTGLEHNPYPEDEHDKKKYEIGVIDTLGHQVIPYGKYHSIDPYTNGYFKVTINSGQGNEENESTQTGFTDRTGKLVLAKGQKNNSWITGNVSCGLIKMALYKYWLPEKEGVTYSSANSYEGFINLKGELVLNDTNYHYVYDFSDNRAFVQTEDQDYILINTKGQAVSKDTFTNVINHSFMDGIAFVQKDRLFGIIDTNGRFILKPTFSSVSDVSISGDYIFFSSPDTRHAEDYNEVYGITKKDGSIILNPVLQMFDRTGFHNGLLKCKIDDKLTYIDEKGQQVWQAGEHKKSAPTNLNIDCMNRGYFHAYAKPDKEDIGGFAKSDNTPQKIRSKDFLKDSVSITVYSNKKAQIDNTINAYMVSVANTTKATVNFNAQDSRLEMNVQALNTRGEWTDIEYLPSSWCGNSYHTLSLEPGYYWSFLTPVYEGDFKTRLRVVLKYLDPDDKNEKRWERKERTLYSNEYEGSVNPGQFWRKGAYYSRGLMNPYND